MIGLVILDTFIIILFDFVVEACSSGIDKSDLSIGCVNLDKEGRERESQLKRGQTHEAERDVGVLWLLIF